jgi:hypothetical protein
VQLVVVVWSSGACDGNQKVITRCEGSCICIQSFTASFEEENKVCSLRVICRVFPVDLDIY